MIKAPKDKVLEAIVSNIGRLRWWPRGVGVEPKVVIHRHYVDSGFVLIEVDGSFFQFPYVLVKGLPEILKDRVDRFIELKLNGENLYIIEAEYTDRYFELINRLTKDARIKVTLENLHGADLSSVKAEPLFPDSTNTVGLHVTKGDERIVIKAYRKLDVSNVEPLIMAKLFKQGFKHVPTVYSIIRLNYGGKQYCLSIILEFIEGEKDLGTIYWRHLHSKFSRMVRGQSSVSEQDKQLYGDEEIDELSCRVGSMVADMHYYLNVDVNGEEVLFGLERISAGDIDSWLKRVDLYVKDIVSLIEEYVTKNDGNLRSIYEELGDLFMEINNVVYDNVTPCFNVLFENTFKGAIHQDLHFQQMMYRFKSGRLRDLDIYILDFEGEPGRIGGRVKEPLVRDIATLANSFMYIWFFSYKDFYGEKIVRKHKAKEGFTEEIVIAEVSRKLLKAKGRPLMHSWVVRNTVTLALSYAYRVRRYAEVKGVDLMGYPKERPLHRHYVAYLTPWIYERTLYEIRYELKHRPSWFPIPLVFLKYPALPYVSCRGGVD